MALSEESRVRARHLDLITRQGARDMIRIRAKVMRSLRDTFDAERFIELETPILQVLHGGAAARPFTTHINAYDQDLYLRIATELYLKRAVVGGVERVYEIGKNFRNEGADSSHSPEFTALEAYEAYGTYDSMARLTRDLVQNAARDVLVRPRSRWPMAPNMIWAANGTRLLSTNRFLKRLVKRSLLKRHANTW